MFEYYKWKLANKPTSPPNQAPETHPPTGKKIWLIALLLAITLSLFIIYAPLSGLPIILATALTMLILLIWLMATLKAEPLSTITKKTAKFIGFLLLATILLALLFGGISVLTHTLMKPTHTNGQIAMTIDLITRTILTLLMPIALITFLRFINGQKILTKIYRKTYLELLITLTLALLASQLPASLILRTLPLTHLIQLITFTLINTLLIIALITTSKHRGILT